jgi:hypothetical protein
VTHQLLAYADDVNLPLYNIDTIKKNTETLINASKEVGLGINVEKTKYMLLSRHGGGGAVEIFGDDSNESKLDSGGN